MSEKHMDGVDGLKRSIDWKQGTAIALGVPLLILPSLGYLPLYVSAAAILIWALSTVQGFFQNTAYAEMATTFPKASGVPGFAQHIYADKYPGRHGKGKLIGGFTAWSYWFGWNPILAIFALLVGGYLHELFPALGAAFTEYQLSLGAGVVIFGGLFAVNWFGLKDGAILSYFLAALSLIPLVILTVAPFATGHVEMSNITGNWWPTDWAWDMHHILILFGVFGIAHWSACAWETAAMYGPEYKNPSKDAPKALFACGIICLLLYVLMQASVIGVLGVDGVIAESVSPLIPVAQAVFGQTGIMLTVVIVMLMAAMVLIIQTAYLGSSRAMHSMAVEGNLPSMFRRTNSHGTPYISLIVIAVFNLFLISMGNAAAVLAASAIGYTIAHGLSLFAYVVTKNNPAYADLKRPFLAPKGWKGVGLFFGLFNVPLSVIGVVYLNSLEIGWTSTIVAFGVLGIYVPIWFYTQHELRRHDKEAAAIRSSDHDLDDEAADLEKLSDPIR
ncbi:amino acid transporter [Arthrobacter sp. PL16]|uniref:APC family permease n=1 Tax=Arthrobacter sp. PL16 TaxID=3071720 RepID=UPI002DFDD7FC|nr:amino acid transporter [Arthrobacter sp. PL16]